MRWSSDVSVADWIVERLHPFAADVGSLVPTGFPAYARILHPGWRTERGHRVKVRWGEPAAAPPDADEPPRVGSLEPDELDVLVELLGAFTGTSRSCWFAIWDGYGWMQGPPAIAELGRAGVGPAPPLPAPGRARIQLPGRSLALYRGPIEEAAAFAGFPMSQSANLWWPHDRSWCVASDIDLASTYLGGVEPLVGCVLDENRLEAVPARVTDPIACSPAS
jgi:hypothetical protein